MKVWNVVEMKCLGCNKEGGEHYAKGYHRACYQRMRWYEKQKEKHEKKEKRTT